MSSAQKILIFGGLILATFGMLYGLHYALFVEHQTLDQMGSSLDQAFVAAAQRQSPESSAAIVGYARGEIRLRSTSGRSFSLDRTGDAADCPRCSY